MMAAIEISLPADIAAMEAEVAGRWLKDQSYDADLDAEQTH